MIGVLALQGNYKQHAKILTNLKHKPVFVRKPQAQALIRWLIGEFQVADQFHPRTVRPAKTANSYFFVT